MIDTNKYRGHSKGPWRWSYSDDVVAQLLIIPNGNNDIGNGICIGINSADSYLIADAPLLLDFIVWVKNTHPHYYHKLTKAYQGAKNNR